MAISLPHDIYSYISHSHSHHNGRVLISLVLHSHCSVKYIPSIQSTPTIESPHSQNPLELYPSQSVTLCTLTVPSPVPGISQFPQVSVHVVYETDPNMLQSLPSVVGAAIPEVFVQPSEVRVSLLHRDLVLAHRPVILMVLPTYCSLQGISSSR